MKKYFYIFLIIMMTVPSLFARWGWGSHRFINDRAVDHLPEEMSFFLDQRDYLSQHAVDPDTDNLPGNYHYIDIDYYPEFFMGTLPHNWQGMIDLYGQNIMEDNGLVPWVIDWWMEDLTTLMENGEWNSVWQTAAELGHYVADSHQPMHLTLNYNGQLTDNYGIHSRYETHMINPHLDEIVFSDSIAGYWESPLDSVFRYIEDIFPLVDLVLDADDRAYAVDPNHNSTYYAMMWEDLGDTTTWALYQSSVNLASIWYTAWVNAGSPYPVGVHVQEWQSPDRAMINAFPNPFNAQISIKFALEFDTISSVKIHDLSGKIIATLVQGDFSSGEYTTDWNGANQSGIDVSSGVYLAVLETPTYKQVRKITLMK